ncbi:MAG: nucleoside phosphorylase [Clostridiales Family XIII bacterium]|jgi:uridine phosphorylase|nr:nucleoside phosphorylase [Clostridiales Family XIII bacterium]
MKESTANTIIPASAPTDGEGRVYHLRLRAGDVPPRVILPGAPERTSLIAADWEDVRELASYREFKSVAGTYQGVPIAAVSTGIGAASSEICIGELKTLGVHTCVRVGTTGCIQPEYDLGDLIIPAACVRKDGTSDAYIEPAYPAAADTTVTMALMQACENLGFRYGVGIGYTIGSFYIGQGRPAGDYRPSWMEGVIPDLQTAGILNIEMEAAGQFVVGRLLGMSMGAIFAVVSNRVTDRWGDKGGEAKASRAASEALRILADWEGRGEITLRLTNALRIE